MPNRHKLLPALLLAASAFTLAKPPAKPEGGFTTVNLPQNMTDSQGNQWMIYQQGWFQTQGNNPVYGQSAMLQINGNQLGGRGGNRAKLDEKTGELLFELQAPQGGVSITRHVLLDKKNGYVRYIDVFKNNQNTEQTVNFQLVTNLNFGVNAAQIVADPKKKERNLAWVAQGDGPSCATEIYAGKGGKLSPEINWQPGNNTVTASYQPVIPAGKQVAILHFHTVSPTVNTGVTLVETMKVSKMLADVSPELRKELINFATDGGMAGDHEVLRGDAISDIVELRGGDQYKGTLQEASYKLDTSYGPVEFPADHVVGLINVGDFRPRQLLVTPDGEIFGGHLANDPLHLQLASGQVVQIPLSQVSRMGYRKRAGEPEEWTLSKPMVVLRSGDRVQIDLPDKPFTVLTRYGKLNIDPKSIASLVLASEEHGVHEITLADGSHFAGLVDADSFAMTLAGAGKQAVNFPASTVSRIQFGVNSDSDSDTQASVDLTNGDKLVGQLAGQMKLDTAFDTITINGPEVKKLAHPAEGSPADVQVTLWDDSTVSGQFEQADLQVKLDSGVTLGVAVPLIAEYTQPQPQPSAGMTDRIKAMVADLAADDFKKRETAESQLVALGPAVVRVLKDLRTAQAPEAQQRIDNILKGFEKKPETHKAVPPVRGDF